MENVKKNWGRSPGSEQSKSCVSICMHDVRVNVVGRVLFFFWKILLYSDAGKLKEIEGYTALMLDKGHSGFHLLHWKWAHKKCWGN
jgi:hypothetical protein